MNKEMYKRIYFQRFQQGKTIYEKFNEFLCLMNFIHTIHLGTGTEDLKCAMGLKQLPILKSCLIQYT